MGKKVGDKQKQQGDYLRLRTLLRNDGLLVADDPGNLCAKRRPRVLEWQRELGPLHGSNGAAHGEHADDVEVWRERVSNPVQSAELPSEVDSSGTGVQTLAQRVRHLLANFFDICDNAVVGIRDCVFSSNGSTLAHFVVRDVLEVQRVDDLDQLVLPNGGQVVLDVLVDSAMNGSHGGQHQCVTPPAPEGRLVARHHCGVQVPNSQRVLVHQPCAAEAEEEHDSNFVSPGVEQASCVDGILSGSLADLAPRELRLQDLPDFGDGLSGFLLALFLGGVAATAHLGVGLCFRTLVGQHFLLATSLVEVLGQQPHTDDGQKVLELF